MTNSPQQRQATESELITLVEAGEYHQACELTIGNVLGGVVKEIQALRYCAERDNMPILEEVLAVAASEEAVRLASSPTIHPSI